MPKLEVEVSLGETPIDMTRAQLEIMLSLFETPAWEQICWIMSEIQGNCSLLTMGLGAQADLNSVNMRVGQYALAGNITLWPDEVRRAYDELKASESEDAPDAGV